MLAHLCLGGTLWQRAGCRFLALYCAFGGHDSIIRWRHDLCILGHVNTVVPRRYFGNGTVSSIKVLIEAEECGRIDRFMDHNEKLRCPFCGGETSEHGGDDGFVHKEDCALVLAMLRTHEVYADERQ